MATIWSPTRKFQNWLEIEILACEAMEIHNIIPKGTSTAIAEHASINIDRIDEIELEPATM